VQGVRPARRERERERAVSPECWLPAGEGAAGGGESAAEETMSDRSECMVGMAEYEVVVAQLADAKAAVGRLVGLVVEILVVGPFSNGPTTEILGHD